MLVAPAHVSEDRRLHSLRALNVLDTQAEERFDRLTELVALVLDVPIALVSLVDEDRQWFKSRYGLDATETPRDHAFCSHAIVDPDQDAPFVVDDTRLDPRFADNPLVNGAPHIRFYAGQVLHSPDGMPVGTLCAIDDKPRLLDDKQRRALSHLATLVEDELHGQRSVRQSLDIAASEQNKHAILAAVNEGLVLHGAGGKLLDWNSAAERLLGLSWDELNERTASDPRFVVADEHGTPMPPGGRPSDIARRTGQPVENVICRMERPNQERIWLRVSAKPFTSPAGETQVVSTFSDITAEVEERQERRRLEADVQRQARRAQVSLDALDQGVYLTDSNGRIMVANAAAERILGYSADEVTALMQQNEWPGFDTLGVPLAPEDRPALRALSTGEPVVGELIQWQNKAGRLVLLRITCMPGVEVDDETSEAAGMVIAFTDVTDEQLSRQLLDVTLEMASAGLAILDRNGVITRCNTSFAEHVGRLPEFIVGKNAFDFIHHDDRKLARTDRDGLLAGSLLQTSQDHRVLRPDGAERWVHTQINTVSTSGGPIAIASTFDITERRQLLREVSRFSHLIEQSNDMISVIDQSGAIQFSSPATTRILGYSLGSHGPTDIYGSMHPDDVAAAEIAVARLMSSTDPVAPFTARTRTADGRWLHIEYAGVNMLDEPAVAGILMTGRDVTQRVELTEMLKHQASHDTLTDLANRSALYGELQRCLAERVDSHVGICFLDLDGFKAINDEFGHAAGDAVLERVAVALRRALRPGETAARFGGDEFVVVLNSVESHEDAVACAERLRDAVTELATELPGCDGLGVSIGVTLDLPGDDASTMLNRADGAMYRAKALGGSSVEGSAPHAAAMTGR